LAETGGARAQKYKIYSSGLIQIVLVFPHIVKAFGAKALKPRPCCPPGGFLLLAAMMGVIFCRALPEGGQW